MNKKKETRGGIVGMLAIACVIAAMLMPPSKAKFGSSLEDGRKVAEWEIKLEKKTSRFDSERQKPLPQDSLIKVAVKKFKNKRPLFERPIFQFRMEW